MSERQIIKKPITWFKFDNIRKHFEQASLLALGMSLVRRQWHPIVVKSDGTVIDGQRRVEAANLVGLETLDAILVDAALSQSELRLAQAATAMHRADLTAWEKYQLCFELVQLNHDWKAQDLAEHLCIDASMVTRIMSASKTVPAVREALKEGKLGTTDVYALSKAPEAEQPALLAQKLNGASRDDLERAVRERKPQTVKSSTKRTANPSRKTVLTLRSGVTITIAAESLDVPRVIVEFVEALKVMRRFEAKGWDLRTVEQVLRDEANRPDEEAAA